MLVDEDSPFLELCPLAAWGSSFEVGASIVTGIGGVEGVECMIIASDPTIRGGADLPTQKDVFVPAGALFRDLTRLRQM